MAEKKEEINITGSAGSLAYKVLVEPWVTEAATAAMELNKYVFRVEKKATKFQIKKAIESLYNVKVTAVNTVNIPKKKINYGRTSGWKSGFRKAVVTLKEGDKIELIKGV